MQLKKIGSFFALSIATVFLFGSTLSVSATSATPSLPDYTGLENITIEVKNTRQTSLQEDNWQSLFLDGDKVDLVQVKANSEKVYTTFRQCKSSKCAILTVSLNGKNLDPLLKIPYITLIERDNVADSLEKIFPEHGKSSKSKDLALNVYKDNLKKYRFNISDAKLAYLDDERNGIKVKIKVAKLTLDIL